MQKVKQVQKEGGDSEFYLEQKWLATKDFMSCGNRITHLLESGDIEHAKYESKVKQNARRSSTVFIVHNTFLHNPSGFMSFVERCGRQFQSRKRPAPRNYLYHTHSGQREYHLQRRCKSTAYQNTENTILLFGHFVSCVKPILPSFLPSFLTRAPAQIPFTSIRSFYSHHSLKAS